MLELLSLPEIVLEKILSYLSYDDIAKYRIICRQFDRICKQLLNKGFILVEKHHAQCLKTVKAQLPRRESERRSHPLARHCDILTAIETRLSMLAMTFTKYVEAGLCCFIPGKVIDEIFSVLRSLKNAGIPPRAHEVLQELRDISSMAMEYFDEKIVPMLKVNLVSSSAHSSYSLTGSCLMAGTPSPRILGQEKIRLEFSKIHTRAKRNKASVGYLKKTVRILTLKFQEQEAKLAEQSSKLAEQDTQIAELKRHLEEWDHKFGDLSAELSRAREESGGITESGTSHDVEGIITRQKILPISPTEHNFEKDCRISRKKTVTNDDPESKWTATRTASEIVLNEHSKDADCRIKKRKSPSIYVTDIETKKKKITTKKVKC
ncbi:F-box only protein 28 [Blattella germanica]|nr:F-box only protein 28 [Blattella germanica]